MTVEPSMNWTLAMLPPVLVVDAAAANVTVGPCVTISGPVGDVIATAGGAGARKMSTASLPKLALYIF